MPNIIFLTGASGVGKTTLVQALEEKYEGNNKYVFLYFDSIGIPSFEEMVAQCGSRETWQKQTTFKWLEKIRDEYSDTKTVIFEGQVNLKFIVEGFEKYGFKDGKIVLIDCNAEAMKKRLIEERNQPELVTDDMFNRLKHLRNQAREYNVEVIDTGNLSKEEAITAFEENFIK